MSEVPTGGTASQCMIMYSIQYQSIIVASNMLRTLKTRARATRVPLPILPPDVRPHRLGVVVNAQRVCRRVVDDIGLFAVVPVSKGEAQTSASWLSAGSFQRQIMLQAAQIHVIYDSTRSGQPRPIGRLGRPGRQHWPLTSTWSRTARPSSRPSRSWLFRRL